MYPCVTYFLPFVSGGTGALTAEMASPSSQTTWLKVKSNCKPYHRDSLASGITQQSRQHTSQGQGSALEVGGACMQHTFLRVHAHVWPQIHTMLNPLKLPVLKCVC
eukprot:1157735-Pelagomonas_calceolata.AAC.4